MTTEIEKLYPAVLKALEDLKAEVPVGREPCTMLCPNCGARANLGYVAALDFKYAKLMLGEVRDEIFRDLKGAGWIDKWIKEGLLPPDIQPGDVNPDLLWRLAFPNLIG